MSTTTERWDMIAGQLKTAAGKTERGTSAVGTTLDDDVWPSWIPSVEFGSRVVTPPAPDVGHPEQSETTHTAVTTETGTRASTV